jgi:hypothetical protein
MDLRAAVARYDEDGARELAWRRRAGRLGGLAGGLPGLLMLAFIVSTLGGSPALLLLTAAASAAALWLVGGAAGPALAAGPRSRLLWLGPAAGLGVFAPLALLHAAAIYALGKDAGGFLAVAFFYGSLPAAVSGFVAALIARWLSGRRPDAP